MKPEVVKLLVEKLAEYYNHNISAVDYEFWLVVFDDVTEQEFKRATIEFIKTGAQYFPKAGQIHQIIMKYREVERLKGLPLVSEGIAEIRASLDTSYDHPPKYSHPLLDKTVKLLGYWNLCCANSSELSRMIGTTYGELRKSYVAGDQFVNNDQHLLDWNAIRQIGEDHGM